MLVLAVCKKKFQKHIQSILKKECEVKKMININLKIGLELLKNMGGFNQK